MKLLTANVLIAVIGLPALANADGIAFDGGGTGSYLGSGTTLTSVTLPAINYVASGTGEFAGLSLFSALTIAPTTINLAVPTDADLVSFGTWTYSSTSLTGLINPSNVDFYSSGTLFNSATDTTELASFTIAGNTTGSEITSFSGTLDTAPVPLPASLPLMLSGLAGLGGLVRRRRVQRA